MKFLNFSTHSLKYIWYLPQKVNVLYMYIITETMEKHENPTVIGNVGELVKQSAEVACDIIQAHDSPPLYTLRLRSKYFIKYFN